MLPRTVLRRLVVLAALLGSCRSLTPVAPSELAPAQRVDVRSSAPFLLTFTAAGRAPSPACMVRSVEGVVEGNSGDTLRFSSIAGVVPADRGTPCQLDRRGWVVTSAETGAIARVPRFDRERTLFTVGTIGLIVALLAQSFGENCCL